MEIAFSDLLELYSFTSLLTLLISDGNEQENKSLKIILSQRHFKSFTAFDQPTTSQVPFTFRQAEEQVA